MAELTAAFAQCIRGAALSRQVRYPAPGAALSSGLAIVDVSSDPVAAIAALKAFADRPACATIAVLQDKDVSLMLTCLRNGALDLIVPPLGEEQIAAAVDRVRERRPEAFIGAASARVLAFVATPGGSGATTVCQSVAFAWKRKFPTTRILIADLDPLTGIQGFLLKLKCPYSFLDVLRRSDTVDPDLWKGTVVSRSGIDLLLAPEQGTPFGVEPPDTGPLLEYARKNYDVVVFDTGGPYGRWASRNIAAADDVLLVTSPDQRGSYSTARAARYLGGVGVQRECLRVLVNRVNRKAGFVSGPWPEELDQASELLYNDPSVSQAVMDGRPVAAGSSLSLQCSSVVEKLCGLAPRRAPTLMDRLFSVLRRKPERGGEAHPSILEFGPRKGTP